MPRLQPCLPEQRMLRRQRAAAALRLCKKKAAGKYSAGSGRRRTHLRPASAYIKRSCTQAPDAAQKVDQRARPRALRHAASHRAAIIHRPNAERRQRAAQRQRRR